MTTPAGIITAQDVNYELGRSTTASINLNDANVRTLAQAGGSGTQISMDNLRNKAALWTGWTTVVNSTWQQDLPHPQGRRMWWRFYIGDMFLNFPNRYVIIPATYYNNSSLFDNFATTYGTGSTYPGTNFVNLSRLFSSAYSDTHVFGLAACQVADNQQYIDFYHLNDSLYDDYTTQYTGYATTRMNVPEIYITAGVMPRYYRTGYTAGWTANPSYVRAAITSGRTHSVVAGIGIINGFSNSWQSWTPSTFTRAVSSNGFNHFHRIRDQTTTQTYTASTSSLNAYLIEHLWEYGPA